MASASAKTSDQREHEHQRQEPQRDRGESPAYRRAILRWPDVTARGAVVAARETTAVAMAQATVRRRAAHCSRLIASSSANDATSMTSATAVAPA